MNLFGETPVAMKKHAVLSECGNYRYRLSRTWNEDLPRVLWIMLNPSTADAAIDDPTTKRCIGFAKSWLHGGIDIVNLFALRSTDPAALRDDRIDPIGPEADKHITDSLAKKPGVVICAWSNWGHIRNRDRVMLDIIESFGVKPRALRVNNTGQPAHPLYLPGHLSPAHQWDEKTWK